MLFPGDAKLIKTDTGREADRVYRLEFSNGRRMFFWMQEPKAEVDDANVKKLNESIDNPPAPGAESSSGGGGGNAGATGLPEGIPPELMQALMGGAGGEGGDAQASAQALQALLGGGGGGGSGGGGLSEDDEMARAIALSMQEAAGGGDTEEGDAGANTDAGANQQDAVSTPAPAAAGGDGISQFDVDSFMADAMNLMGGSGAGGAATPAADAVRPVPLSLLVDSGTVDELMSDDATVQSLLPHLPEGQQTPADLRSTLLSPQFQQALGSLSGALQTENFNTVFANFNLDPADGQEAVVRGDGVGAFVSALQAAAQRKRSQGEDSAQGGSDE